jgi:lipopolysaccharide transport system ATP-binding protein
VRSWACGVQIARKFDDIVDFSGVEGFLDTPVKRYSSGMYVRLAFAIAAHLEPEILLVDEVLAVGDTDFQKKCLGKMDEVARGGRTVLFVSHDMTAVESLCKSAIFLNSGELKLLGTARDVISAYSKMTTKAGGMFADLRAHSGRKRQATPLMTEVAVVGHGADRSLIRIGDDIAIIVKFQSTTPIRPCCSFTIKTDRGTRISHVTDWCSNQLSNASAIHTGILTCYLTDFPLMPGRYLLDLWLTDFSLPTPFDVVTDACWFEVSPADVFGSGKLPPSKECMVLLHGQWSLVPLSTCEPSPSIDAIEFR